MGSSHQPRYWDSARITMATAGTGGKPTSTYSISLPQGTLGWRLTNADSTNGIQFAGNLATLASSASTGPAPLTLNPSTTVEYAAGQEIFIANNTTGAIVVFVQWWRDGRQPSGDAGTAVFSADLTP